MQGLVIKNISNDYTVLVDNKKYICKPRGKFRNNHISPLVGDYVKIDEKNNYIMEILPRKNVLVRPPVANLDQIVIVMSIKEPDFSSNLLDKLLAVIEYRKIRPIICFTKLDLLKDEEKKDKEKFIKYYEKIGYDVYRNDDIESLIPIFKDKVTAFTGQSGAGKSTLLNKIDSNLNLKTDEISIALGRGKHTTRHTELLKVGEGLVADTPGFSSLDFIDMTKQDIRDSFIEFNKYRENCKYQDCMHDKEEDCAVKKEIDKNILKSRYENYLKFIGR